MRKGIYKEIGWDLHSYNGWLKAREVAGKGGKKANFITISREFGCDGYETASKLGDLLNDKCSGESWQIFTHPIMESIIEDEKLSAGMIDKVSEERYSLSNWFFDGIVPDHLQSHQSKAFTRMRHLILNLASKGNCIIVGAAAQIITNRLDRSKFHGTHFRLIASPEFRIKKVMQRFGLERADADNFLAEKGDARDKFVKDFTMHSPSEDELYHLILNNGYNKADKMAKVMHNYIEISGFLDETT